MGREGERQTEREGGKLHWVEPYCLSQPGVGSHNVTSAVLCWLRHLQRSTQVQGGGNTDPIPQAEECQCCIVKRVWDELCILLCLSLENS